MPFGALELILIGVSRHLPGGAGAPIKRKELEMRSRNHSSRRWSALRPTPALVVAFVALFAAMGGFGYAAVKIKQSSVKTKNIKNAAVTTDKIADGAVTTPKLAPDAVAPSATNATERGERDQRGERGEARRRRPGRVSDRLAQGITRR